MAGTRSNPDNLGVPNSYAGNVAPKRPDQSTVNFYGDNPRGNTVDRSRINPTMGGSGSRTQSKPLGAPQAR